VTLWGHWFKSQGQPMNVTVREPLKGFAPKLEKNISYRQATNLLGFQGYRFRGQGYRQHSTPQKAYFHNIADVCRLLTTAVPKPMKSKGIPINGLPLTYIYMKFYLLLSNLELRRPQSNHLSYTSGSHCTWVTSERTKRSHLLEIIVKKLSSLQCLLRTTSAISLV